MDETLAWTAAVGALGALTYGLPQARLRLQLSRAKHRSLAGHSRMAKRLARWMPGYAHDAERFYQADGAPDAVAEQRRQALAALAALYRQRFSRSVVATAQAREGLSDLQFTARYRVPFPFSAHLREQLSVGAFVQASDDLRVQDLDGNWLHDLTGSYGVNLFGHAFYKSCLAEATRCAAELGPVVLGSYAPWVLDNIQRLKRISGLDEVSFHMSGTEAVMQAVRLARYHTRRTHLVRFCGAYHGWWEDVQPGPGNPLPPRETYTLRDLDERSLAVLRSRRDIACVLVNPLQALHPNDNAPGDGQLVGLRDRAGFDRAAYATWLKRLREVCSERGIVLIFDEVFVGFRLAPGGAQASFGVQADLVTYGKTLGGGLPVGVVCGRSHLMKRWREDRPADICFARGTFNAHPLVMAAMNVFLRRLDQPEIQSLYRDLDATWDGHARRFNEALAAAGHPVRVANLSTIWTVLYTEASRYHWMLQFYLRAEGLALSWVGTGRMIFTLRHGPDEMSDVLQRFLAACQRMQQDGWWWRDGRLSRSTISRQMVREMAGALLR